ncbi:hypothetical protein Tco_0271504 [Tanacetum coccineum]
MTGIKGLLSTKDTPSGPQVRVADFLLQQIGAIRGTQFPSYQEFRMTGPTPDPITPSGQVVTNVNSDTPNLQEQILNQLSSLKALVKLHNDTPSGKVTLIRLSFGDEPGPDPPGGPEVEELKGRDEDLETPQGNTQVSPK